jgi:hypothetical protein
MTTAKTPDIGLPAIELPINLVQSETWSFNGAEVLFTGAITGSGALTLSLADNGVAAFDAADAVGDVSVVGGNSSDTGSAAFANGTVFVGPGDSLNAGGNPVSVTDAVLYAPGTVGPLTASGSVVDIGNGESPYGSFAVDGAAILDSASFMDFYNLTPGSLTPPAPVAGTDYPTLSVSGSLALGSAQLAVSADCGQPLGTVYDLIDATGGLSGQFTEFSGFGSGSGTITNGEIIQAQPSGGADSSCSEPGSSAPYLQFNYNDKAGMFTATVVAPPPSGPVRPSARAGTSDLFVVTGATGGVAVEAQRS